MISTRSSGKTYNSEGESNNRPTPCRMQVDRPQWLVWFFKNNQSEIHHLRGDRYDQIPKAKCYPI
ncbi:MAG: hypothetical protein HY785_16005 [Oscillatoriophycideae cyanobacterium NC_groundwater_1537_Pr4_S-0.65um_50_18]|nr:hypothetical protein [Oscillatoriophycideae cyanobacterium NC_groundwater_1537_Pr4_S-0.65um_50_18]